ncbi:MAG: hypothetical protein LBT40_11990 [Deltaproteobacteria bacterium]|nr:hypothetical protein [Deltaproteobacteria bacterium]
MGGPRLLRSGRPAASRLLATGAPRLLPVRKALPLQVASDWGPSPPAGPEGPPPPGCSRLGPPASCRSGRPAASRL